MQGLIYSDMSIVTSGHLLIRMSNEPIAMGRGCVTSAEADDAEGGELATGPFPLGCAEARSRLEGRPNSAKVMCVDRLTSTDRSCSLGALD